MNQEIQILLIARAELGVDVWRDRHSKLDTSVPSKPGLQPLENVRLIWQLQREGYLERQVLEASETWIRKSYTRYNLTLKGKKLLEEMGL